jgi:hypothetical protein
MHLMSATGRMAGPLAQVVQTIACETADRIMNISSSAAEPSPPARAPRAVEVMPCPVAAPVAVHSPDMDDADLREAQREVAAKENSIIRDRGRPGLTIIAVAIIIFALRDAWFGTSVAHPDALAAARAAHLGLILLVLRINRSLRFLPHALPIGAVTVSIVCVMTVIAQILKQDVGRPPCCSSRS